MWMALTGALCASLALLASILAMASETRKNGSLIKKEVYKMDDEF